MHLEVSTSYRTRIKHVEHSNRASEPAFALAWIIHMTASRDFCEDVLCEQVTKFLSHILHSLSLTEEFAKSVCLFLGLGIRISTNM